MGRLSVRSIHWCAAFASVVCAAAGVEAQTRSLGIDVSAWQGSLSQATWNTFKNSANRDFVWIRSSRGGTTGTHPGGGPGGGGDEGTLSRRYDDPYFQQNITYATKAGMFAGAYHFDRADILTNTGADEANHFLQMAGPWMRPGYLLPMFDMEAGAIQHTTPSLSNWSIEFSNTIFNATGIRPVIYLNTSYATSELNASVAANMPNLVLARPSSGDPLTTQPPTPDGYANPYGQWASQNPPWKFWQYSTTGGIPGYSSNIDKDVANGGIEFVKDFLVPALWTTNDSGDWSDLTKWNSGAEAVQPPILPGQVPPPNFLAGGVPWSTASPSDLEAKPVARAPGVDVPLQGVYGSNDTVILERTSANPTITLSSGAYNIRKLYARETFNITGGSLGIGYVPSPDSTPFSAQFSAAVSISGGASLSVHTVDVDATRTFTIGDSSVALNTINLKRGGTPAKIAVNGDVNFSPLNNAAASIAATGSGNTGTVDLTGGQRVINVADGSAAIDLTIGVPVVSGGLTKAGAGTLALTGNNTYAGDTIVQAGRLSLATKTLANGANVYLTSGATLELNYSGSDAINALFIDGVMQDTGIWGAHNASSWITGMGTLQVSVGPSAGDFNRDGYVDGADLDVWASGFGGGFGGADFLTWQRQLGKGALEVAAVAPVPEPASAILGMAALAMLFAVKRRADRRK